MLCITKKWLVYGLPAWINILKIDYFGNMNNCCSVSPRTPTREKSLHLSDTLLPSPVCKM